MARLLSKSRGRLLIGWIAAYALVLHAVLAGIVATQLTAINTASAGLELCLTGADGAAPGHGQTQHENCAIHCSTVAGGAPLLTFAFLALLLFPRRIAPRFAQFNISRSSDYLFRAGLSRAPPLPA